MPLENIILDMDGALEKRQHPAITRWNRLEGRPRTHDFDRALKAEVRDAMWMLCKQWQMGEFHGEDAGSPILARMCIDTTAIDRFQAAAGGVETLDLEQPLETRVERRALPLNAGAQYLSLDLRMTVGRRWLKILKREADAGRLTADYGDAYIDTYAVAPPNPASADDALICAHPEAWQQASLLGERALDGIAFLEYAAGTGHNAWDDVGADPADEPKLATLALGLAQWFRSLIVQPDASDAWLPPRLEY